MGNATNTKCFRCPEGGRQPLEENPAEVPRRRFFEEKQRARAKKINASSIFQEPRDTRAPRQGGQGGVVHRTWLTAGQGGVQDKTRWAEVMAQVPETLGVHLVFYWRHSRRLRRTQGKTKA